MTSWNEIEAAHPSFALRVRTTFAVRKHATMATLRSDGSPRISGTEVTFEHGDVAIGSMAGALKALDLRRDPRIAIHCPTVDPPEEGPSGWAGDGKIAGIVVEEPGPDGSHVFRIDVTEVVLTRVGTPADHLVIESWHPGRGLERRERR